MNFGNIVQSPCVNVSVPADNRCDDPAYALAHPDVCPVAPQLIIKPGLALVCVLGSVQFNAFVLENGVETDVTEDTIFTSGDQSIVVIGATSGNATGLTVGAVTITATYGASTARADLTVLHSDNGDSCCADNSVAMMVMVDTSRSMSLTFNGTYNTKLAYAKAAATRFISEVNETKDLIGLMRFNAEDEVVLSSPVANKTAVGALVAGIAQTQKLTAFYDAIAAGINELDLVTTDRKILILITDGEDLTDSYTDDNNPFDLLNSFKEAGGIVMCVGVRASGAGYALLSGFATGGFFINGHDATAQATLDYMSGLKGYLCAGNCTPEGDVIEATPQLDYDAFSNWTVLAGSVNLVGNGSFDVLPGNGMYLALDSTPCSLETNDEFAFESGKNYRIKFSLAGNQKSDNPATVIIQIGDFFSQTIQINDHTQDFMDYNFNFTVLSDVSATIKFTSSVDDTTVSNWGPLLDRVILDNVTDGSNIFSDTFDGENMVYVPPRCGTGTTYVHLYYSGEGLTECDNVVPVMTNHTTPNGEVSASSELVSGTTYYGWRAFNGVTTTVAFLWISEEPLPQWLQYKFDSPKVISKYTIYPFYSGISADRVPNNWVFQGSLDGAAWTTLDTRTGSQVPSGGETYDISAPNSYLYYRITITSVVDLLLRSAASIVELELLECSGGITAVHGYQTGYNCYGSGCLEEPPVAQSPDPNPLANIEAGFTPPQEFTSTKTACASCPDGFINFPPDNLVPVMTSNLDPEGEVIFSAESTNREGWRAFDDDSSSFWVPGASVTAGHIGYKFDTATVVNAYSVQAITNAIGAPKNFTFEGSQNGSTWTVLDTQSIVGWYSQETKRFNFTNSTAYLYYRVNITDKFGVASQNLNVASVQMHASVTQEVCVSASAVSTISQTDADNKATAAALASAEAQLNCVEVFTSTQQCTAQCPLGEFGTPITKSATETSLISQEDADSKATTAACEDAADELDCTMSNNTENVTIPSEGAASPYPTVKYVEGMSGLVTKVTVTITGFSHGDPSDVHILLRSPSGTLVELMGQVPTSTAVSSITVTFDDDAASQISNPLTGGTYKPSSFVPQVNFPYPVPAAPYLTTLAAFIGETPNGSWAVWVYDDSPSDIGSIASGWNITITTA